MSLYININDRFIFLLMNFDMNTIAMILHFLDHLIFGFFQRNFVQLQPINFLITFDFIVILYGYIFPSTIGIDDNNLFDVKLAQ